MLIDVCLNFKHDRNLYMCEYVLWMYFIKPDGQSETFCEMIHMCVYIGTSVTLPFNTCSVTLKEWEDGRPFRFIRAWSLFTVQMFAVSV